MKTLLTIGFAALSLAACVSSRAITLPDGRMGELIECNRNAGDCVAEAGQICPRGYDLLASGGQSHPYLIATSAGLVGGTSSQWTMMVHCH